MGVSSEQVKITIKWGSKALLSPEDDRPEETFRFDTIEEANGFMLGVVCMDGWLGYEVLFDGREEEV